MAQDKSCRSVNFRKCAVNNDTGNCELLYDVDSENPELLYKDEHSDYLVLLSPIRVSVATTVYIDSPGRAYWADSPVIDSQLFVTLKLKTRTNSERNSHLKSAWFDGLAQPTYTAPKPNVFLCR